MRTISLDSSDRAIAVLEAARASGHSRFPVLDQDDNVVGTVHVKHAVALPPSERHTTRIKHLMVRPIVVPDSLRLDPLLSLLRADGFQMAVVLDEYGGQAGIVTLEDVVEEIVGDIADEHDPRGAQARQLRDGSWTISGLLRPDEVADLTEVELPESEEYDTVGGLVMSVLGKVPDVGDVAEVFVPDRSDTPDGPELRHQLAVLTVDPHGRAADRPAGPAPADSARRVRPREQLHRDPADRLPAPGQRVLRGRGVRPRLRAPYPDRAARRGRQPLRAHDAAGDGEHVRGHRRQPARGSRSARWSSVPWPSRRSPS